MKMAFASPSCWTSRNTRNCLTISRIYRRFASMRKLKLPAKYQFPWNRHSTRFAAIASELCGKHSAKRSKRTESDPISFPRKYYGANVDFGHDSQAARLQNVARQ